VYGVEDANQERAGQHAAPRRRGLGVPAERVGTPVGGAGFGVSKFGFGQLVMFFQTLKEDMYIDLKVSLCTASGTISIDHKPRGARQSRDRRRVRESRCARRLVGVLRRAACLRRMRPRLRFRGSKTQGVKRTTSADPDAQGLRHMRRNDAAR